MPLIKSTSKKAFSENVSEMMNAGHPQKQALAAAFETQRRAKGKALGGVMGGPGPLMSQAFRPMASPMPTNSVGVAPNISPAMLPGMGLNAPMGGTRPLKSGGSVGGLGINPVPKLTTGPLVSSVPGRTDKHFTHVPSGSYVIPADVVSGHGQGNTLAGMNALHNLFKMDKNSGRSYTGNFPSRPSGFKKGGSDKHVGKPVPVKLAGGEIVVPPHNAHETMERLHKKKLTLDEAHKLFDDWVITERKKLIKTLKKLPGPARD